MAHVIHQPAGRGDDDVDAGLEGALLRPHLDAAVDRHARARRVVGEADDGVLDLRRQLARRRQDEGAAERLARRVAVGRQLGEQPLQDRHHEGERLAGAGLGAGDDVAAVEGQRDDRGLHRAGLGVAHVGAAGHQPRVEAERGERTRRDVVGEFPRDAGGDVGGGRGEGRGGLTASASRRAAPSPVGREEAWKKRGATAAPGLSGAEGDDAADRVVGGDADGHAIAGHDLDAEAPHPAAQLRQHFVARLGLDAIQAAASAPRRRCLACRSDHLCSRELQPRSVPHRRSQGQLVRGCIGARIRRARQSRRRALRAGPSTDAHAAASARRRRPLRQPAPVGADPVLRAGHARDRGRCPRRRPTAVWRSSRRTTRRRCRSAGSATATRCACRRRGRSPPTKCGFARAIGAVLSARYRAILSPQLMVERGDLFRGAIEDRYVGAFFDREPYQLAARPSPPPDRVALAIEMMRVAALSTYENQPISTGVLLLGDRRGSGRATYPAAERDEVHYTGALTSIKSFYRLADGLRTVFLVNRAGRLLDIVDIGRWADDAARGRAVDVPVRADLQRPCPGHARRRRTSASCSTRAARSRSSPRARRCSASATPTGGCSTRRRSTRLWQAAVGSAALAERLFRTRARSVGRAPGRAVRRAAPARASRWPSWWRPPIGSTWSCSAPASTPWAPSRRDLLHLLAGRTVTELDPSVLAALATHGRRHGDRRRRGAARGRARSCAIR